jgi:hypothetical protein
MALFDYPTLQASSIIKDDLTFLEHWSETDWESLKVLC